MAVNRFTGATDSNWGTATNWSQGTVPTAADGHDTTFDATSPNCTVNTSNRVCNRITFAGYTNTITMSFNITVSGDVTLGATMNVSGAGSLILNATSTVTSNGFTWPNTFQFGGTNITYTLADNLAISGTLSNAGTAPIINGNTINLSGNLAFTVNGGNGSTNIVMNGTGTWSGNVQVNNNLTFNTAGTITVSGTVQFTTKTLTYTAGTMTTTGSTLTCSGASAGTLNTSGMNWTNVTVSTSGGAITLTSNLNVLGNLSTGAATSTSFSGAFTIYVGGNLTMGAGSWTAAGGFLGFVLNGTGTWSGTGTFRPSININTAGTITISGTTTFNTGTLTYTTGTINHTGTLNINATTTLSISGPTWNSIIFSGTSTITNSGTITCGGNLTVGGTTLTTTINGGAINVTGNVSIGGTTATIAGTMVVNMVGSGTLSAASQTTGTFRLPLVVNTAGTVTFSGTIRHTVGGFTFTAGTINASACTYTFQGTMNINQTGFSILQLTLFSGNSVIDGTYGFTMGTLNFSAGSLTHTFKNGATYDITTAITTNNTNVTFATPTTITSDSAGNPAFINLLNNGSATQDVAFLNVTDISAAGGLTIWNYKGTLSNATNWKNLTTPQTLAHSF